MTQHRSPQDIWTRIVLDTQMTVLEISNPQDTLFFGKRPKAGQNLVQAAGEGHQPQAAKIAQMLDKALLEKRNVSFQYLSENPRGVDVYVSAHIAFGNDSFTLYLTTLDQDDLNQIREADLMRKTLYDKLPVGIEIYDRDGYLIDINPQELLSLGMKDKKSVLGINLFKNPNLPKELEPRLRAGESLHFTTHYDFQLTKGYYHTSRTTKRYIDVNITVLHDKHGGVDKYLLIAQDITNQVQLQYKYDSLVNQNTTILESLPVGVGLYSPDGTLIFYNDVLCRIFGIDRQKIKPESINLNNNPILPEAVKEAVRKLQPIQIQFPYDFDSVTKAGYFKSEHTHTRQINCNGRPVQNQNGEIASYIFIVEDVTDTMHNVEQLRQSKRKTELAISDSDIMLWEFDAKTGYFLSDNDPMNGYDRTKAMPSEVYINTAHPDEQQGVIEVIRRMKSGEDFNFRIDYRILFPNNPEWQYCTISGSSYARDAQGHVIRYVGTRKNNTELQRRKFLQEKILNSIPMPIHIKDVEDNFRYVFCNDESKRMFGSSEDKTAYDVMDVKEAERIQKTDLEVFNSGKPYLGLERIELKDGRSYDTIVRKSIIHDGDKRLLLNIRWDQSLQNDLERRAKVLSITMAAMSAYTWVYEPEKNQVRFGEGFDKACPDAEMVDSLESFAQRVHPEDRQQFLDSMISLLNSQSGTWSVEYRADLNSDGIYEWWETRGILETTILNDAPYKYMFGMSICIESHKRTELTLLRNKEDLKTLIRQNELVLNNTNSGLAYITTDYIVQWENISMCSASLSYEAYKRGELCYKSAHNRNSPCENCVLQRALVSRQLEQIKFQLDAGHTVEVFATPVFREDDSVDGIVIRVDDVTERERMFAEMQHAKAMAEQSDKLKSAFLANMSHEIRTPLNAIVGFSELLMSTEELQEKEEYMQIINDNNDLLLKLINDILDLSKIEAGSVELKYETFDLSDYFNGMAASMKLRVRNPNVRLLAVNPHQVCLVNLDRNRIAQILTNYVTNAIKYTPKGFIEMGYEFTGAGIRFYVKDSGIGIADEKKEKVFHRFEKLDEFAQGTGLGLSIVKAIAESMGGRVGFESNAGEGSLFWAYLPCDAELATASIQASEPEPGPQQHTPQLTAEPTGRRTILIAEDIPSNYLLISTILHKQFNLLHAQNGVEVVEMARQNQVDLVLMDMKMPLMDGLTATAEIRKFNTELPIVALTAHAFEADRIAAMEAGCNDYLVKPINKEHLTEVLQNYCGPSTGFKFGK